MKESCHHSTECFQVHIAVSHHLFARLCVYEERPFGRLINVFWQRWRLSYVAWLHVRHNLWYTLWRICGAQRHHFKAWERRFSCQDSVSGTMSTNGCFRLFLVGLAYFLVCCWRKCFNQFIDESAYCRKPWKIDDIPRNCRLRNRVTLSKQKTAMEFTLKLITHYCPITAQTAKRQDEYRAKKERRFTKVFSMRYITSTRFVARLIMVKVGDSFKRNWYIPALVWNKED